MELTPGADHSREDILFCLCHAASADEWFGGSSDMGVHVIQPTGESSEKAPLKGHQSYVTGVATTAGKLWSVGYDRLLNEWDLSTHQLVSSRKAHDKWIRNIEASPDGSMLATVGDDMIARLWQARTGNLIHPLQGHAPETPHGFSTMLYACAFSPDSKLLATADRIGEILVWDTGTGEMVHRLKAPIMYTWDQVQRLRSIGGIRCLRFSPDGSTLAVGGMGHVKNVDGLGGKARIEWFDIESGQKTGEFESDTHNGLVEDMRYLTDGSHLLATGGGGKGFLLAIDTATQKAVTEPEAPMYIHRFHFVPESNQLLAVGHRKTMTWTYGNTPAG